MSTFYTSDHHFGHKGILRLVRGEFSDVQEMDDALIEHWNSTVRPTDTVFHLGDFSLCGVRRTMEVSHQLNGKIILLAGNHDPFWRLHSRKSKARQAERRYAREGNFHALVAAGAIRHTIAGRDVLLSHLPYYGDSQADERYTDRRPKDRGLPIICGHVHDTWRKKYGGDGHIHNGQTHVGVDVWGYRPIPEEELIETLAQARPDVFGGGAA